MSEERAETTRTIRAELIIAICALLVSTLATLANWYQTKVVGQQLSAQVWPYINIEATDSPNDVRVGFVNYGLGPALVRDDVLVLDGKPQRNLVVYFRQFVGRRPKGSPVRVTTRDIGAGSVIRPGETSVLFDLSFQGVSAVAAAAMARTDLRLCYCSILEQCWIASAHATGAPQPVARCDEKDPSALQTVDFKTAQQLGR